MIEVRMTLTEDRSFRGKPHKAGTVLMTGMVPEAFVGDELAPTEAQRLVTKIGSAFTLGLAKLEIVPSPKIGKNK